MLPRAEADRRRPEGVARRIELFESPAPSQPAPMVRTDRQLDSVTSPRIDTFGGADPHLTEPTLKRAAVGGVRLGGARDAR